MRVPALIICAVLLQSCSGAWEKDGPSSLPGGTGITVDNVVETGPDAVSSVSQLPARNRTGSLPPYGTQGHAAAYEFASGYKVGAGDRLNVRVVGESDLSGDYVVDPTGLLSLPYVRSVPVAGMTTSDIERLIIARLRDGFLRDPKVSVQAVGLRPFYIMGEVTSAGSFPYQGGLTVQQAIAVAGGYGPRADLREVLLTRRNARGTNTFRVPVTTQIYPGDIVFIRERWF